MEELKKNKQYIEAINDKKEGMGYLNTSCITCKFKPNYMDAIPSLRSAADGFLGLGKTYPKLYKENLIMEEIFCREKLIISYENEKSWIDASDQGIKITKYYIIYYKNYDMAWKSFQNAIITYLQTTKSGNANVLKAIKAFNEIGQLFLEHEQDEWANKNYQYSYDTILSLFPGQAKSDQPYEILYEGLFEYFDFMFSKRNFEIYIQKLLEVIELISPNESQLASKEIIQGKENDVDKILIFYYKILCVCIIEENEDKLNLFYEKANSLTNDSVQRTILDEFIDIYKTANEGNEKDFNRHIAVLKSTLRNSEMKELRGVMKKNKPYESQKNDNNNNINIEFNNDKKDKNLNQKEIHAQKEKNNINYDAIYERNTAVEMRRLSSDDKIYSDNGKNKGINDKEKDYEIDNFDNDKNFVNLDYSFNEEKSDKDKDNIKNRDRMEIYKIEDEESDPNIIKMRDDDDNDRNGKADDYL
jgi:hypothetical protein